MVLSVQDVKSVMVGPGAARFKVHHKSVTHTNSCSSFAFRAQAEIHFNPQLLSADRALIAEAPVDDGVVQFSRATVPARTL